MTKANKTRQVGTVAAVAPPSPEAGEHEWPALPGVAGKPSPKPSPKAPFVWDGARVKVSARTMGSPYTDTSAGTSPPWSGQSSPDTVEREPLADEVDSPQMVLTLPDGENVEQVDYSGVDSCDSEERPTATVKPTPFSTVFFGEAPSAKVTDAKDTSDEEEEEVQIAPAKEPGTDQEIEFAPAKAQLSTGAAPFVPMATRMRLAATASAMVQQVGAPPGLQKPLRLEADVFVPRATYPTPPPPAPGLTSPYTPVRTPLRSPYRSPEMPLPPALRV